MTTPPSQHKRRSVLLALAGFSILLVGALLFLIVPTGREAALVGRWTTLWNSSDLEGPVGDQTPQIVLHFWLELSIDGSARRRTTESDTGEVGDWDSGWWYIQGDELYTGNQPGYPSSLLRLARHFGTVSSTDQNKFELADDILRIESGGDWIHFRRFLGPDSEWEKPTIVPHVARD